jgi:ferrochelatase
MQVPRTLLFASTLFFASWSHAQGSPITLEGPRVGVLFSSFGDIDDPSEAQDYVIKTLTNPSVIPLPELLRFKIAHLAWTIRGPQILEKYKAIGGRTNYRAVSQKQADLVASKLREYGYDARGYTGFTFTFPFIHEALKKAQDDGVTQLVVVNQGAQYANVTTQLEFREVRAYLEKHPEWPVQITGIRQFSEDYRFRDLMAQSIQKRIKQDFAQVRPENLCIFLPMHGNLIQAIDAGDPSYDEMLRVAQDLQARFSNNTVSYGFLNQDDMPFFTWTKPKDADALRELVQKGCQNILINGRITFTIDSVESLYDQAIVEKNLVQQFAAEFRVTQPKVTVEKMFNLEWEFINFQAQIISEALQGRGDLERIR